VESLCLCDDKSTEVDLEHEERQQALLELYAADGLRHYSEDRLVNLATSAKFYRVCEAVYGRRGRYDEVVACYWRDPARRHLTFSYVQSVAADRTVSTEDRRRLRRAVTDAVSELVKIDARRTAKLLLVTLSVSATEVMEHLDSQHQPVDLRDHEVDADRPMFHFLSGLFDFVASAPNVQSTVDSSVHERYVEILCRLRQPPRRIVDFLQCTGSGYRLAEMLAICRRYAVTDAVVCLLEKSGDVRAAFDILLERLTRSVIQTDSPESDVAIQSDSEAVELDACVEDVVGLLQRGSRQLEPGELETVWFQLLDFLMDATKSESGPGRGAAGQQGRLKSATRHVINAMMSHVAPPAVLQRIIANEACAGHFGDVRDLLTGVLDACSYERTLLGTCARLVNADLHAAIASLTRASRRATRPLTDSCPLCGRAVLLAGACWSRDVVCFHCGHVVHRACLLTCCVTSPGASRDPGVAERRWKCPVCCRSTSSVRPPTVPSSSPTHSSTTPAGSDQLDSVQLDSIDRLRSVNRSPSRLTVLAELAQLEHTRTSSVPGHPRSSKALPYTSILHSEQFALRLAAPPPACADQ